MTFETIEEEACAFPTGERGRLIARLVALQVAEDDPGHAARMAGKIDSTDPSRWKTIEEVEARRCRAVISGLLESQSCAAK